MSSDNLFPFEGMIPGFESIGKPEVKEPVTIKDASFQEIAPKEDTVLIQDSSVEISDENTEVKNPVKKKERKKPNRPIDDDDTAFVITNLKTMSYPEMAEARGLTKHQVSRILTETRKTLRDKAAGRGPGVEAKVEKYIIENLTKPDDGRIGNTGGEVKDAINEVVQRIYNSL